jgi:hypothetical protein
MRYKHQYTTENNYCQGHLLPWLCAASIMNEEDKPIQMRQKLKCQLLAS